MAIKAIHNWLQTSSKLLLLLACPGSVLGWPHWVVCYSSICQFSHDWGLFIYPPPTHTYAHTSLCLPLGHVCTPVWWMHPPGPAPMSPLWKPPLPCHFRLIILSSVLLLLYNTHASIWAFDTWWACRQFHFFYHYIPNHYTKSVSFHMDIYNCLLTGLSVSFDPFWLFSTPQPERAFSSESQEFLL